MRMTDKTQPPLITFPTRYPLKIMGKKNVEGFLPAMQALLAPHLTAQSAADWQVRASSSGNYQALTLTFMAESREQLDAMYQLVSKHPMVVMAL